MKIILIIYNKNNIKRVFLIYIFSGKCTKKKKSYILYWSIRIECGGTTMDVEEQCSGP
jgi:hypothetical protein